MSKDSLKSHDKFVNKYGLTTPLLSDEDHAVQEAYGVWVEKKNYGRTYWGTQRATALIDEEGVVRRVWPKVKVAGHVEEVLAALQEL